MAKLLAAESNIMCAVMLAAESREQWVDGNCSQCQEALWRTEVAQSKFYHYDSFEIEGFI